MSQLETRSTSRQTAVCDPIILREGEQVRLVFMPTLVDNAGNPKASVDGCFVYQRKAKSGRWIPIPTIALSTLKSGDEFKLTLHANELRVLIEGLARLYKFYEQSGIPPGQKTFVEVDRSLAKFVSLREKELADLLESQSEEAQTLLAKLVTWLATSPGRREAAERLASMAPDQMPSFTAFLGIASVKEALAHWKQNQAQSSEEFWQQSIAKRSFVLGQIFSYPIVIIGQKAYVGGKQISRIGGKEVDFLIAVESTDAVILLEIKTPTTKLLGQEYRGSVFPLSHDLTSAVAQVLKYRQNLTRHFDTVTAESPRRLTLGEPRCVVLAGNTRELQSPAMRDSFELQRERMRGVTIIAYDELFRRLERFVALLEGTA